MDGGMSIFQERLREKSAVEQAAGRQARMRRRRIKVIWCCVFMGMRLRQFVGGCQLPACPAKNTAFESPKPALLIADARSPNP